MYVQYNLHFIKMSRKKNRKTDIMNQTERRHRVAISTRPIEGVQLSNMRVYIYIFVGLTYKYIYYIIVGPRTSLCVHQERSWPLNRVNCLCSMPRDNNCIRMVYICMYEYSSTYNSSVYVEVASTYIYIYI